MIWHLSLSGWREMKQLIPVNFGFGPAALKWTYMHLRSRLWMHYIEIHDKCIIIHIIYTKKHALQVHWPASHMHDGALTCIIYTVHDNTLQTQSHAMPCINMHCKALQLHEHELQWCRYIANALPVQHELQKHWYAFHCIHKHSHAVQVHKHPGVETALRRSDFIWRFGCKKNSIFKVLFEMPCLPGCAFEIL